MRERKSCEERYCPWLKDGGCTYENKTKCALDVGELPYSCECCSYKSLEDGDTLYTYSSWDGGIEFNYIRNIKYCPVCGRKLPIY